MNLSFLFTPTITQSILVLTLVTYFEPLVTFVPKLFGLM